MLAFNAKDPSIVLLLLLLLIVVKLSNFSRSRPKFCGLEAELIPGDDCCQLVSLLAFATLEAVAAATEDDDDWKPGTVVSESPPGFCRIDVLVVLPPVVSSLIEDPETTPTAW